MCMLYIICWAVEVSLQHVFSPLGRESLILDCPGQTRALLRLQQPVDLVHALKTVKGLLLLVPPRTPRSSGYDVYAHAVYVVISVLRSETSMRSSWVTHSISIPDHYFLSLRGLGLALAVPVVFGE